MRGFLLSLTICLMTLRAEILPMPPDGWPARGSLLVEFSLPDISGTLRAMPEYTQGYFGGPIFELPFVDARLWTSRSAGRTSRSGINFNVRTTEDTRKMQQLSLSRLDGDKRYQLIYTWDEEADTGSAFLQGVPQSDLGHWGADAPPMAVPAEGEGSVGGEMRAGAERVSSIHVHEWKLFDHIVTEAEARDMAKDLPPLSGEGRTIYTRSLALEGLELQSVFETDFSQPLALTHEVDLLEEDRRVRLPESEWVLEGPHATAEIVEDGLRLRTAEPADRRDGHIVLWNTREMPADFLFEYEFTPKNDEKGLGIVFFNTRNPKGDTIFDLDLPPRFGRFREYIVGEIDSYHVSPWATDDTTPRRTANMRKNSGFMLVAVGNDLIGGSGAAPHTVRILKRGGHVQVESNGVLALEYHDDGVSHGPVHNHPGLIGLRFMAHGEEVVVHRMKVWALK
ncbi:MAG: DUF1961 family protein [Verrucomicrobia bacterium]|nr:DUF1961 family protein [Verrucomicrobiota bacterium]MCH8513909.1 YesU family protein [Kiritimatiellia bacterium]